MFDSESETDLSGGSYRLMRNWLKSRWIHAWVLALVGALDILSGTDEVDLPESCLVGALDCV